MTNKKELVLLAKQKATETFNSLPFETRKNLANGYDRLLEIELLLSKGDNLSICAGSTACLRVRPRWLFDF